MLEWHFAHLFMSTGRILVSKNFACSGVTGRCGSVLGNGFGLAVAAPSAAAFFLARAPFANRAPAFFLARAPPPPDAARKLGDPAIFLDGE